MDLICIVCNGLGEERRQITHPMANIHGWQRCDAMGPSWYKRRCERCDGSGYVPSGTSVPTTK